jgi:hypothetical protein
MLVDPRSWMVGPAALSLLGTWPVGVARRLGLPALALIQAATIDGAAIVALFVGENSKGK